MKSKYTEIKNKATYIQDQLGDLLEIIKEAELGETLNTSKAQAENVEVGVFLGGSTVNELLDYEETIECESYCIPKAIGIVVFISAIIYLLSTI